MALFNYASREITLKVVYYGPGLSGKTTNLQWLHENLDEARRSKLLSLATETDRTLFFDFLPMDLGNIGGFKVKFQLYTVPGQVRYDATRKLVLKGADAIVFVADSQKAMRDSNTVSFENMKENLTANNLDYKTILFVLQFNKRDLPDIMSVEEMNADLNERKVEAVESIAVKGVGVRETFDAVSKLLVQEANRRQKMYEQGQAAAGRSLHTKVGVARMGVKSANGPGAEAAAGQQNMGAALWNDVKPGPAEGKPIPKPPPPPSFSSAGQADVGNLVDRLTKLIEDRRRTEDEILALLQGIKDRLS